MCAFHPRRIFVVGQNEVDIHFLLGQTTRTSSLRRKEVGETRGEDMDIQLIIVILCIIAAAYYFGRRVYTAVSKGKCGCCDGGCGDGKKSSCGCTPNDAEAQRLESKRLKFEPKK